MRNSCPVCNSRSAHTLSEREFLGMEDIVPFSSYAVSKCDDCGMIYASNIIETMPLDEYYNSLSKYETKDYFSVAENDFGNEKIISFTERYINKNDNILEIGCGTGTLLYKFKQSGYKNLIGIEPSKSNVAGILDRWNIPCCVGALGKEISEIKGKKFKLIIMSGVLEHILPLREAMNQAIEYLDDDGYLFLAVPDITTWGNIEDMYQQFSVEHVNYFSLQSLTNLLGVYGCRCVKYEVYYQDSSLSLWQYSHLKKEITFANDGDAALDKYLKTAEYLSEQIKSKLMSYQNKKVYLWGAGTHTAMLYQMGFLNGINVQAIIDSNENFHGKSIFGFKIIPPKEILTMDKLPIIISSQNAQKSIKEQISKLCDNEVLELY